MKYITSLLFICISKTSLATGSMNVCEFGSGFKQFSENSSIVTHEIGDQLEYTVTLPKVYNHIYKFDYMSIGIGRGENYRKMEANVNVNYAKIVETTFYVDKKEVISLVIRANYINLSKLEAEKNGYTITDTNFCNVTLKASGQSSARL